ncbi:TetR/AcrR family transcriptional regulator [Paracoccus xiamenensis]|uniref:TetR/AcrR family transcriptional regulator n=1 Tax=Paracoccus xiamenensis TaxID=2714901 RepID=UPI00140E3318|nr:TetR/AcrR family transcriptional regulator [Paracoccus xiamenensis]NHF74116.1 TetR/AcrR family transcriptional regulator [Paracoccus xiamenensis]
MQEKTTRSQAERREATQSSLVSAARELFARHGFAGVGAPEIAQAAGVTRGAITHHFKDKTGLFQAVVTAEAEAVGAALADWPAGDMAGAVRHWFAVMETPGRAQILLIDGPAVLGVAEMARIDAASGAAELGQGLAETLPGMDPGQLAVLAEILSAGFDRAALRVADGQAAEPYITALLGLIEGLRPATG